VAGVTPGGFAAHKEEPFVFSMIGMRLRIHQDATAVERGVIWVNSTGAPDNVPTA
jgi:hypothetical protein